MISTQTIEETKRFIKHKYSDEGTGHDWWHIYRVWQMSVNICEEENGDPGIVQMAALLHEIADHKLVSNQNLAILDAEEQLLAQNLTSDQVNDILHIITNISYKGAGIADQMQTLEGKIVQDADRLDALGAIGIARTFAYGGSKNRLLYDPQINPVKHDSFEEYKKSDSPTINHFYEKLLLLKDRMHTVTARKIAEQRHQFMEVYLQQFYAEWQGSI